VSDVLGCGVNTAAIYDRNGEQQLLALPRASALSWGRRLNEISTGVVTIPVDRCTVELDNVHTWAHTLVIFRRTGPNGGRRVWEGPIRRKRDTRDGVVIEARDVLGWTERRAVRNSRRIRGTPVKDELVWSVDQAFALDDPNVTSFVQSPGPVGDNIDRDLAPWSAKHAEDIANLAGVGGRFTVVGRAIVVFADEHTLGRTPVLTPENHLLAEVEIIEDGDLLLTAVTSRDDNNRRATVGGVDAFYGLVEDVISPGSGKHRLVALERYAQHQFDQSYPAPVQLDIPSGAQLRTDAPFPIELLVPGTLVPVETTTATGRTVRMTAVLASVDVTQNGNADEVVTITVVPVSQAVTE
jgi:hypothetical protein